MLNLNVIKKGIFIIALISLVVFNVLNFEFAIANTAEITISNISSVTEGDDISFKINFANNVKSIMVFEGDIITKGFTASSVNLTRALDNSYTVTLIGVNGIGNDKYVIINAGVGYVDGKGLTDEAYSNKFSINKKQEETQKPSEDNNTENNNTNNSQNNNQNSNTNNDQNNNQNSNTDNNLNNNQNNNTNNNQNSNIDNNLNTFENNEENDNKINEVEQNNTVNNKEEIVRKTNPNTGKI